MRPETTYRRVATSISEVGWSVVAVNDRQTFAYTVGLTGLQHPELAVYGLPAEIATGLLNQIGMRVKAGERLTNGQTIGDLQTNGYAMRAIDMTNVGDLLLIGDFYSKYSVLQIVWPDQNHHWPWQHDYSSGIFAQPLKGKAPQE